MKKILITGCLGQLGRALTEEYADDAELFLTEVYDVDDSRIKTLDITDAEAVEAFVGESRPDVIINCAAMTNVDGCEDDFDLAYRTNALGPRNLGVASNEVGAKLIHISTDYVFPGTDSGALREYDEPAPVSAYGITKLEGEKYVRELCDKWFIIRTAWMFGEGKNFVRTMIELAKTRDSVTVVDDQIGSPTSAKELARVIRRMESTKKYGIYHATCEGRHVSWADFAAKIFEIAGLDTKVIPISTEDYKKINPKSAKRPAFSVLDNFMLRQNGFKPMAEWEDALKEYLGCQTPLHN